MRFLAISLLLLASLCSAQTGSEQHTISVTGDAEVKVVPNRITIMFGVETRDANLEVATSKTDAAVKRVITAARQQGVDESDIQTDQIQVNISYNQNSPTTISYYTTNKGIQVVLKDTTKFEALLQAGLRAGANKIDDVIFKHFGASKVSRRGASDGGESGH